MSFRTLVSPLLLCLSVSLLLVPAPTFAACCGCNKCWMRQYTYPPCVCNGTPGSGCSACMTEDDDSDILQSAFANVGTASLIPTVAKLDVTERVIDLMRGGNCYRDGVALSLLGNAREGLKFVPFRFDETTM
jgi:hypothetical protein